MTDNAFNAANNHLNSGDYNGSSGDLIVGIELKSKNSLQKSTDLNNLQKVAMVYTDAANVGTDEAAKALINEQSEHLEASGVLKKGGADPCSKALIDGAETDPNLAIISAGILKQTSKDMNKDYSHMEKTSNSVSELDGTEEENDPYFN